MMEPQDLASRELRAIKRTLCYVGSTACALCLVCTATTMVLLLGSRMKSSEESNESKHQTQTQGDSTPPPYQNTAHAQLKWWREEKNVSSLVLWRNYTLSKRMKYQDGNLTALAKGLYFINCQLHFKVTGCFKNADLWTDLFLNGRVEYRTMQTLRTLQLKEEAQCKDDENTTADGKCMMYTNQHLSLQIQLNVYDNISIHTSHPHWLHDGGSSADSIVFGAFMIWEDVKT